jgi:hypothetical protein
MDDEEIKDRFTSTKPNIPKPEEFLITKPEIFREEKEPQAAGAFGPAIPSSEESYSSDEEAFEPDY